MWRSFGFNVDEIACEYEDNFIREDILECLINEILINEKISLI